MDMKHDFPTSNSSIESILDIYKQDIELGNEPKFNELAKMCREDNRITDEIRILKLAVSFYENSENQTNDMRTNLQKFRTTLTARQKEAKVMEILDWTD